MSLPDKENPKKSEKININLISQDDHLTAGAWATCGVSSDKLNAFSAGMKLMHFVST